MPMILHEQDYQRVQTALDNHYDGEMELSPGEKEALEGMLRQLRRGGGLTMRQDEILRAYP